MALGTEAERDRIADDASGVIEWGYRRYGDFDYSDFAIGDVDRGGSIEEAANVMVEAVADGDPERLRRAVEFLRGERVPRRYLRTASEVLSRESGSWEIA